MHAWTDGAAASENSAATAALAAAAPVGAEGQLQLYQTQTEPHKQYI